MARYLLVGHLTRDLLPDGSFRYGGAVLYAGLTARRLGFETRIITSSAEEGLESLFPEFKIFNFPAPSTTVFENLETPQGRRQRVLAKAPPIDLSKVPSPWLQAEIIHLAPVLEEISPEAARYLETKFLVANPQGWFREIKPNGEVVPRFPDLSLAPRFKALVISEEDLGGQEELVKRLLPKSEMVVLTMGERGSKLFWRGETHFQPAESRPALDTVGAGDIFAAAFFAMLYATNKPLAALRFASCLAAFSVMREGLASVPTLEEISSCLER